MSNSTTTAGADETASVPQASASRRPKQHRSRRTHQRRVTLVQCLLNTNESNGGASAVAELRAFMENTLFTERGLARLILHSAQRPNAEARHIQQVDINVASIEIGPRQQRVHAHWVMKIEHSDMKLNVGLMQGELQQMTREHTSFMHPFASVVLLNAAAENYALKEQYDSSEE